MRRARKKAFLFLAAASLPLAAAEYYVATNGNNSAAGTLAAPWRHIQHAVSNAMPGDTVYVRGGRYVEHVRLIRGGTNNAPITFAAMPGEQPVIDGTNTLPVGNHYWAGLFEIVGRHNVRVEGLGACNSYSAGFFVRWATNVIIARCATSNTFSSGLQAWRSHTVYFLSNAVQWACDNRTDPSVAAQECITVAGTTNFVVAFNHVYNRPLPDGMGGEGIDAKQACYNGRIHDNHVEGIAGETGIYIDGYNEILQNVMVYNNHVHHCINGISIAAEVSSGRVYDLRVFNNVVHETDRHGVEMADFDADARKERIDIYNNTCVSNGYVRWGGGVTVSSGNVRDVRIFNNICADNRAWQIAVRPSSSAYVTVFKNGLYHVRNYSDSNIVEQRGTNYVEANPQFVNMSAANYALQETSPMIDAGTNLLWTVGDRDIAGNQRLYGIVDMGAYEFVPEPLFSLHFALTVIGIVWRYCKTT